LRRLCHGLMTICIKLIRNRIKKLVMAVFPIQYDHDAKRLRGCKPL